MGKLDQDSCCFDPKQHDVERVDPTSITFDVPNRLALAGLDLRFAKPLFDSAARRGWHVSRSKNFADLISQATLIPPGGLLLLDTSILSDRSGIERLTQLSDLPALPRIYLTTPEMDVNALAVREICMAASITVQDILLLPLSSQTVDLLLGT